MIEQIECIVKRSFGISSVPGVTWFPSSVFVACFEPPNAIVYIVQFKEAVFDLSMRRLFDPLMWCLLRCQ